MPIKGETATIRDLIYYQYAKIIVRRAFGAADGKEVIIYLKTKDILSRTKLSKSAHRKRSGDADGDGELTVLDIDHIIA